MTTYYLHNESKKSTKINFEGKQTYSDLNAPKFRWKMETK